MSNVSHISRIKAGEFQQIMDVAADAITATYVTSVAETINMSSDVIIIGIGDGGVLLTPMITDIISAHDAGIPILFMHDCPNMDNFCEELTPLGAENVDHSYEYQMFDRFRISNPVHPVLTSYFDIRGLTGSISETHNMGIILSSKATIVLDNPNEDPGTKNFYLACVDDPVKGRVAFMALGHNQYKSDEFIPISKDESKILINVIQWLTRQ